MRSSFGGWIIPGLQYATTAFYAIAVAHGLWLDRRDGAREGRGETRDARRRAWARAYATGMVASFLVGSRRAGDRTRRARVAVLLVLFYGLLRAGAAVPGRFEGDDRHRRGAVAEGLALLLAYALAAASADRVRR